VLLSYCLPAANAPAPLRAIAARASQNMPAERYADASALNREIGRYLDGQAVEAYRECVAERLARFVRRNWTLLLLLAAYVLVRFFLFFLRRG